MEIFLSWSGEESRFAAAGLRRFVGLLYGSKATTWFSPVDIAKGRRWNHELADALQRCGAGIICATKANQESSWLMFEAGALARTVDRSNVFPYLIGVEAEQLGSPLRQFQVTRANRSDTLALAHTINGLLKSPVPRGTLDKRFKEAWPALARRIGASSGTARSGGDFDKMLADLRATLQRLETLADFERLLLKPPGIRALERSRKIRRVAPE